MANPFYLDKGYSLSDIGTVVKLYGLLASLVGVVAAGGVIARFGLVRALVAGSVMMALSQLGFLALAHAPAPGLVGLGLLNAWDNLAQAMHGTALIAFLSGCTSASYTATQYALFSSLYAMPGKFLEGFSGRIVDHVGYEAFYGYTALLNVPGLLLLTWLAWRGGVVASERAGQRA
jgi:PAT family beta-lactamase induction signal transducer AmpG